METLRPSRIPINTILACFDPEVILLLQRKFLLKATKVFEEMSKINIVIILDFLSAHLAILCLLGVLMLVVNWIIDGMSKI